MNVETIFSKEPVVLQETSGAFFFPTPFLRIWRAVSLGTTGRIVEELSITMTSECPLALGIDMCPGLPFANLTQVHRAFS